MYLCIYRKLSGYKMVGYCKFYGIQIDKGIRVKNGQKLGDLEPQISWHCPDKSK